MSPRSRPRTCARPRSRRPRGRRIAAGLIGVLALVAAGCAASFDPTEPCTADGRASGAYPELEAAVPTAYLGATPSRLDSGRICTPAGLGTFAGHGVKELRFGGATWSTGTDSGITLAVFTNADASALDPAWVFEFFETGARAGRNVTSVDTSDYGVSPGLTGRRIDALNGESYQSIVVWEQNGRVSVALIGDFIREIQTKQAHEAVVAAAVSALAG